METVLSQWQGERVQSEGTVQTNGVVHHTTVLSPVFAACLLGTLVLSAAGSEAALKSLSALSRALYRKVGTKLSFYCVLKWPCHHVR